MTSKGIPAHTLLPPAVRDPLPCEYLQEWKRNGNKLILWTCRAGEALSKAVEWCREQNLEFDAVNDNLPEIIEFYGHNSRKISCDYYIDDRMLLPENVKA